MSMILLTAQTHTHTCSELKFIKEFKKNTLEKKLSIQIK